jgi:hypothetical protein
MFQYIVVVLNYFNSGITAEVSLEEVTRQPNWAFGDGETPNHPQMT